MHGLASPASCARVRDADLAVVAGVGHVASAVRGLEEAGLDGGAPSATRRSPAVLGICVGLQLLFGENEEGGAGLGILTERCGVFVHGASRTWAGTLCGS